MVMSTSATALRPALDPRDYVFGVIDDPIDAIVAIEALHGAGFCGDDLLIEGPTEYAGVRIATGRAGSARQPSAALAAHEDAERLWTRLQQQVRAGHTVIQVYAPDFGAFDRALAVLEASEAHAL